MAARIMALVILLNFTITASVCSADCNGGDRYEDNANGTVTDCRTGLIWLKNANCRDTSGGISNATGYLTWFDAIEWVAGLGNGICGLTDGSAAGDWRLPTKTEWMAMIASAKKQLFHDPILTDAAGTAKWTTNGNAFDNIQYVYWSLTSRPDLLSNAWYISLSNGFVDVVVKESQIDVWPVRGGQLGSFGYLLIE